MKEVFDKGLEKARRESVDRGRWRLFLRGHPFGEYFRREQGVRDYSIRYIGK